MVLQHPAAMAHESAHRSQFRRLPTLRGLLLLIRYSVQLLITKSLHSSLHHSLHINLHHNFSNRIIHHICNRLCHKILSRSKLEHQLVKDSLSLVLLHNNHIELHHSHNHLTLHHIHNRFRVRPSLQINSTCQVYRNSLLRTRSSIILDPHLLNSTLDHCLNNHIHYQ